MLKILLCITGIKSIFKYIHIENSYFISQYQCSSVFFFYKINAALISIRNLIKNMTNLNDPAVYIIN